MKTTYEFLKPWNTKKVFLLLLLILILVDAAGAYAAPADLEEIQWKGNRYHSRDYATIDAYRKGKPLPPVEDLWQVRKRGEVGSCTHAVAIKYKWLLDAGYMPIVVRVGGNVGHTYVVVPKDGTSGYWKLDDNTDKVQSVDRLYGWFGTLANARVVWSE